MFRLERRTTNGRLDADLMDQTETVKNCPNGEDEDPEFCVRKKCPGQFLCRVTLSDCVEKACSSRTLCPDHTDQAEEVCSSQLEPQKPTVTCRQGEFQCDDTKQCVASVYVCDGFEDCKDGSDETNCPSGSSADVYKATDPISLAENVGYRQPQAHGQVLELNEFKCPGGLSIPLDWVCDGRADCPGGEDEEIGPSTLSKCVPRHKGLRESPSKYSSCPKGTVHCGSVSTLSEPKCINQSKLCDGTYDCPDFADELTDCVGPAWA
ncbi:Low-density lipoprotein receptor domain class A [Opisthorchis viverrini]|uniref:Low-density lipoprotein receptor domain class A n=1 Tax=Opisthorchis viverrini TaxID=6198 RepID=A0A1S8X828_OPIVI|nr:Low-density lipoprotein receptor domain class A [Opisthorchis viverrini]